MLTMSRILVIDDDTELCELLIDYLQPEGFTVSAIHQAGRGLPAPCLRSLIWGGLDVMLPGMSGIELENHLSEMETMSDYLAQTFEAITGSSD